MPIKSVRFYTLALLISDALAVLAAFTVAYIIRTQFDERPLLVEVYAQDYIVPFLFITPVWLLLFWAIGLYEPINYMKRLTELGKLVIGSFVGILVVIGYDFVTDTPLFPARLVPVYALGLVFVLLAVQRELLRRVRENLYRYGRGVQRVMIIGSNDVVGDLTLHLGDTKRSGYEIVATVGSRPAAPGMTHFRSLEKALSMIKPLRINTIIQTELNEKMERNRLIMLAAQESHIQYCFIPGEAEFYSGKNKIDIFLGYPIISVYQTPLIGWGEWVKRALDLVLVGLTLPVWGSLLIMTVVLQKIFNPGPIFYKSQRLTQFSRSFTLLKLRSMSPRYGSRDAAEEFREMGREDLALEYEKTRKVARDPRITRFGHFLRVTSLDELPQLLNVLKGDISLVGPRPILPQEMHLARARGPLLHSVKSGMTGLWQVSGRSNLSFEKRIELELFYAQNWSLWLDIKILFKTLGVVFFKIGAR